ncbi:MAG: DUF1788 domain-containing protein [Bacillota bacterium]|jgi:hypothetical protein
MRNIDDRLAKIESKIMEKDFLKNKGLGNEVGYYIFDYSPKDELYVRSHIGYLKEKINKSNIGFKIVEFDLYNIVINILKERGYLEKCFEFEKTKGIDYVFAAIIKMLRLTNKNNFIVNHIVEKTPAGSVVFLTGVGKCFPFIRSHNVLNTLHQVLDKVPVVMFFPGVYSGQELQLFGTIKDDNYYRAFKLV